MRLTVILIIAVVSLSRFVEAQDWAIRDLYGDSPPLLIMVHRPIDLTFKKESSGMEDKEREKTLWEDLHEFLKENLFTYTML